MLTSILENLERNLCPKMILIAKLLVAEFQRAFKIKILQDWKDDLKDKDSEAFKELSSRLETEVGPV